MFDKSVLIFGCGNILLGDDVFGPAVVERLNREDAARRRHDCRLRESH